MTRTFCLFAMLALPAVSQEFFIPAFQDSGAPHSRNVDYQNGMSELDARRWDEAIAAFNAAAARGGTQADAALYWKAYAENRAGRPQEAFLTLREFAKSYPASRWRGDAKALEVEMRSITGAPLSPGGEQDDDLKLLALNSLMQSDPNTALPILRKLLASNNSEQVKERALFVLTQSGSPDARRELTDVARNNADPSLQRRAIRYLGMLGSDPSRKELSTIYNSSSDVALKREVLRGFMISRARPELLNILKTEKDPQLRREAIRNMALSGGKSELWQLYRTSNSLDDKRDILHSAFVNGDGAELAGIARNEKNPELQAAAIQSLGLMGKEASPDVLVSIYRSSSDDRIRHEALNALFLQQNGKALVELARSEKDGRWKQAIVQKMALVHTKETTDYMLELLK